MEFVKTIKNLSGGEKPVPLFPKKFFLYSMVEKTVEKTLKTHQSLLDAVLMILLIFSSGNPGWNVIFGDLIYVFVFTVVVFCFGIIYQLVERKIRRKPIEIPISFAFPMLILLEIIHFLLDVPLVSCLGMCLRYTIAYFAVIYFGERFVPCFVKCMYWLAIISLVFWGAFILPGESVCREVMYAYSRIGGILASRSYSFMILFNINIGKGFMFRNSGCFWEPGAFQGYLNLALMFLIFSCEGSFKKAELKKYFLVLSITVFSTLSTTGFIAYFLILQALIIKTISWRNAIIIFFAELFLLVLGVTIYYVFDFMREKIIYQTNHFQLQKKNWQMTRIGSLFEDTGYFLKKPICGWGSNLELRYGGFLEDYTQGKGNGFSDFLVKNGLYGMIVYLVTSFQFFSFGNRDKIFNNILGCVILIVILQGEVYLNYPLFLTLIFLASRYRCNDSGDYGYGQEIRNGIA